MALLAPFFRAVDANGNPLAGARLHFYRTGGLVEASTYTTSALSVAHANPVVADSGGLFVPIYLDPEVSYRAILKSATGSTIQDIDPLVVTDPGSRIIYAGQAPYLIQADGSDETTKLQSLFDDLQSGDMVVFPNGYSKITETLTLGDGSSTSRSTVNSVTLIFPGAAHEQAFIDPSTGLPKSGFYFEWSGAAGGTMMEWAGPINGIRIIGALQLDGQDSAAYGLRAFSFSNSIIDEICAYNCTTANIDLDTVDATSVDGDSNGIPSAHNTIQHIHSFCANSAGAIALRIDGYEVASGQDVTGTKFGAVRLGYKGTNGKGLWLGYSDFNTFDYLICINNGSISGTGSPIYLDGSSLPFEAPTTTLINWFAATGGTVTGGTNGKVVIENYSLDDGGSIPFGVTGVSGRVHSANATFHGLTFGDYQRPIISTTSDDDGLYGKDASGNHKLSLTRQGNDAHLAGEGDIEFEAGVTSSPSSACHFKVTTTGAGYPTGVGGAVTQATSRTTGVTLNKVCGAITLVSAAGSTSWQSFTLTNSTIAANDTVRVCQASGTDLYQIHVTNVAAGSCKITFATTGGTTSEQPVFNFAVLKGSVA